MGDEVVTCVACGKAFEWSAERARAFDYLGFTAPPTMCARCRRARRRAVAHVAEKTK